ncbi:PAC2 family protein [Dermacoccus abyssi]|uniref:PAC2 family protein n=1 Tax=Dermacoccus abyssi TaxID=322596 RepID=UPI002AD318C7|nr:PAC2 family protein [Dermacoccus abyssi]
MLDPAQLFRLETDTTSHDLRASTMVVALGGFIDAGFAQKLMSQHILGTLEHTVVASFDLDQLLDYRGRRPVMTFDRDRFSEYDDPSLVLYRVIDAEGTPFLLLTGPEPDYQWERVAEATRMLASMFGVSLMVSAHGIPMAVPHTRPIGFTRYASNQRYLTENEPLFGNVQIPASAEGLLHIRLAEAGIDTAGFAVHVPHYLVQVEYGDAAIAALECVTGLTGLAIPAQELAAIAGLHRADIAKQVGENDEVTEVVSGLEQQYDTFTEGRRRRSLLAAEMNELPSADEIGEELEQFLRSGSDENEDTRGGERGAAHHADDSDDSDGSPNRPQAD